MNRLPSATQSKLRSTQILVSLPQVISELVQNSLDAEATHVDVGVDCETWSCWVRDDGVGMSKSDLEAFQHAGRYGTSKAYSHESLGEVSTFGFRGEALASAADMSCLEICSRTRLSRETWSIIIKDGKTLYSGAAVRWRRETAGTVVCVRDAFYNLPIRRLSHPSPQRTLELIRKEIETIAFVFPHVAFTLEDTHIVDTTRPERRRILSIPKMSSSLATFRHIFGRALVEHVEEINESKDKLAIQGFVSLEGTSSKTYQYLFINRHILNTCELHRIIDSAFASSTFARHALDEYMELSQTVSAVRRSPRKSEKRPTYVLNITVPPREVDNCVEPTKTAVTLQNSSAVSSFLASIIDAFLVKHGFKAQRQKENTRNDGAATPSRKRRRIDPSGSGFGAAPRVALRDTKATPPEQVTTPVVVPGAGVGEIKLIWTDPRTGQTFAIDKRSGNSYSLDSDGGNNKSAARRTLQLRPTPLSLNADGRDERAAGSENDVVPEWIREALEANNTYAVKEPSIPALPLSSTFADAIEGARSQRHRGGIDALALSLEGLHMSRFTKQDLRDARVLGQVDRKFIACIIDSNPIAAAEEEGSLCDPTARSLVLIDQHAADERVRVEKFMTELCLHGPCSTGSTQGAAGEPVIGPRRRTLDPPALLILTRPEVDVLARSAAPQSALARWGIELDLVPDTVAKESGRSGLDLLSTKAKPTGDADDHGYSQVAVKTVPEVVANKLLTGDRLRDLVKNFLADWDASGPAPTLGDRQRSRSASGGWQRDIRGCPKDLVDLINSKACRGAIMFNDVLRWHQCAQLVDALCETALPFQCAHGRPSLVPLTRLVGEAAAQGIDASRHVRQVDWASFG